MSASASASEVVEAAASAGKRVCHSLSGLGAWEEADVLERVLEDGDLATLTEGRDPHLIREPALLKWRVEQKLKGNTALVDEFMDAFRKRVNDMDEFLKMLRASVASVDPHDHAHLQPQESLMRVLLGVPSLQLSLIALMMEKLLENMHEGDVYSDMPQQILRQLRWLEAVFNESELSEKLMMVIHECPERLQKELISAVPEIVTDSTHQYVVEELDTIMVENTHMTVPVLDAMSNLTLSNTLKNTVSERVLNVLNATSVDDLPVVLRFLLQNASRTTVDEVVKRIVDSLKFIGVSSGKRSNESLVLVIEALSRGLRFHNHVAIALLKLLDKGSIKAPIECWLLFLLARIDAHCSSAQRILKKRVINGSLPLSLIQQSVSDNADLVTRLAQPALYMADALLQATEVKAQQAGAALYESVFRKSHDAECRKQVVENIITHVGSGKKSEVDCALRLLLSLVKSEAVLMREFLSFLKGLVDYCEALGNAQLRLMFEAFAELDVDRASSGPQGDEISILVTKLLKSDQLRLQRVGIIGCLRLINALHPGNEPWSSDSEALQLTKHLTTSVESSADAVAFLCDQVIIALKDGSIGYTAKEYIYTEFCGLFQDNFIRFLRFDDDDEMGDEEGAEPEELQHPQLPSALWMNLDGDEAPIAIKILPNLLDENKRRFFCTLAEITELLEARSSAQADDEDERDESNDAFLGAPLVMFERRLLHSMESLSDDLAQVLMSSIVYAISWIRAIINSFATATDPHEQWKLSQRLCNLLELQELTSIYIPSDFVPLGLQERKMEMLQQFESENRKAGNEVSAYNLQRILSISRSLQPSVFCFFSWPLKISKAPINQPPEQQQQQQQQDSFLYLDTFLFLVQEFGRSVDAAMRKPLFNRFAKTSTRSPLCFSEQLSVSSIELLKLLGYGLANGAENSRGQVRVWAAIGKHLRVLWDVLGGDIRLEDSDSAEEVSEMLLQSIDTALRCIRTQMNCPMLNSGDDESLLQSMVLYDLCGIELPELESLRLRAARKHLFEFLAKLLPDKLPSLEMCVLVATMLQELVSDECDDSHQLKSKLSELCHNLLTSEWNSTQKFNAKNVGVLCKIYISYAEQPLDLIEHLAYDILSVFSLEGECMHSEFPSTLSKKTMVLFFKTCVSELASMVEHLQEQSFEAFLQRLQKIAEVFWSLTNTATGFSKLPVLASVIASGRVFVDNSLKHFALINTNFDKDKTLALETISQVQKTTTLLHRICLHAKRTRAASITARVPMLKKSLETLLQRVKKLFYDHDMRESFRSGRVKKRGLDGQRVEDSDHSSSDEDDEQEEQEQDASDGRERAEYGEDDDDDDDE